MRVIAVLLSLSQLGLLTWMLSKFGFPKTSSVEEWMLVFSLSITPLVTLFALQVKTGQSNLSNNPFVRTYRIINLWLEKKEQGLKRND
jgi:hypothetical protein